MRLRGRSVLVHRGRFRRGSRPWRRPGRSCQDVADAIGRKAAVVGVLADQCLAGGVAPARALSLVTWVSTHRALSLMACNRLQPMSAAPGISLSGNGPTLGIPHAIMVSAWCALSSSAWATAPASMPAGARTADMRCEARRNRLTPLFQGMPRARPGRRTSTRSHIAGRGRVGPCPTDAAPGGLSRCAARVDRYAETRATAPAIVAASCGGGVTTPSMPAWHVRGREPRLRTPRFKTRHEGLSQARRRAPSRAQLPARTVRSGGRSARPPRASD